MNMELNILNLGTDSSALVTGSKLAARLKEYGEAAGKYALVVPAGQKSIIKLSDKVSVYGSGGKHKIRQLLNIYKIAFGLLKDDRYDIITVQDPYFLSLAGYLLSKKTGAGLEIQVHGWEKYGGIRTWIARFVLPRAAAVRTVSQRLKRQLIGEFGVKEEKITVVPIFVESLARHASLGDAGGLKSQPEAGPPWAENVKSTSKFVFLTVGRLVGVKNISLQIDAMAEVVKKYPETELWIVGQGPEEEKLKVKSLKSNVGKNIKFLGWQSEVGEFYAQADAFMLTSFAEGWPLVIAEAASYGLPMIMTEMGSAGEFIKNNENGIIVPIDDRTSLIQAMIRMIEDESLRLALGRKAAASFDSLPDKQTILELYTQSWRRAAEKL